MRSEASTPIRARSCRGNSGGAEERVRAGSGRLRLCETSRRCETSSPHERRGMGPVDRESGYGLRRPATTEAWMSSGTGTSRPSRRFSVSFLSSFLSSFAFCVSRKRSQFFYLSFPCASALSFSSVSHNGTRSF